MTLAAKKEFLESHGVECRMTPAGMLEAESIWTRRDTDGVLYVGHDWIDMTVTGFAQIREWMGY